MDARVPQTPCLSKLGRIHAEAKTNYVGFLCACAMALGVVIGAVSTHPAYGVGFWLGLLAPLVGCFVAGVRYHYQWRKCELEAEKLVSEAGA